MHAIVTFMAREDTVRAMVFESMVEIELGIAPTAALERAHPGCAIVVIDTMCRKPNCHVADPPSRPRWREILATTPTTSSPT